MNPDVKSPAPSLRLREITGADGQGVITSWLARHGEAKARFRVRIGNLSKVPRTDWNKKQFHKLKDAHGVAEIKWEAGNKQFRTLGFDIDGYFVMLIGCTHKDDNYDPSNCINTAIKLKQETERRKHRIIEFNP
jgi:hypothetical protein